jgi:O-antigen/teichoic acid export membrane protein
MSQSSIRASVEAAGYKVLIILVNGATGILCARYLAPEGRGELAALNLWYVFLASTSTMGVPSALTFWLCRHPEKKQETLGTSIVLALLTSVVAIVVGFFGMPHWLHSYPPEIILYARIFLLNTPISAMFLVGRAALESQSQFRASSTSILVPPIGTLVVLVGLALTHQLTPVTAGWAYVLAGIPSFLWMLWLLHRQFTPVYNHFFATARTLLAYGIRSYGVDFCGTMALYIDQALVVRLLLPGAMGIYVVALSASRMLNIFHTAAVMVLFPKAVSRSPAEVLAMTERAARISTLIATACGAVVAFVGPQLLHIFYGHAYSSAVGVLRILIVEVILSGATLVISQAFMALNRPGTVTAIQASGLILTVPLMLVLTPRFGTEGAAVSLLVATLFRFLLTNASLPASLSLRRPRLLPTGEDTQYLFAMVTSRFRRAAQPTVGEVL